MKLFVGALNTLGAKCQTKYIVEKRKKRNRIVQKPLTKTGVCGIITMQFLSWYRDAGKVEAKWNGSYLRPRGCRYAVFMRFFV